MGLFDRIFRGVHVSRQSEFEFRRRFDACLPHEQGWRLRDLFDLVIDEPDEAPSEPAISYCGDYGEAAGKCFAGALWLVDHAGIFLRALKEAHRKGHLSHSEDPVTVAERIFHAISEEVGGFFGDERLKLISQLMVDLGISLQVDASDWEEVSRERFVTHAERAALYFSGTGHELFVLPWAFQIEQATEPMPLTERIASLRATIRNKVRGLEISELELNNWAYFLLLVGRWQAATAMATLATEMARLPRNLDTLGWANYFEGNHEHAIQLLSESLKELLDEGSTADSWGVVAYHKLYVLIDAQRTKEAHELLNFMIQTAPGTYWTNKAVQLQALLGVHEPDRNHVKPSRTVTSFAYDVALSFAGEDRAYAQELAEKLQRRGIRVFYDEYEKADLWGRNLYDYLTRVYEREARYCIMLISENYASKRWAKLERQAAQARAFRDETDYILPVRLDSAQIPGLLDTIAYLSWNEGGSESIVDCVLKKLRASK